MNDSRNELIAATLLLLEDDLDLDDFQAVIEEMNRYDLLQLVNNYQEVLLNKDGSERKVRRIDYSRGKKRIKSSNPWDEFYWLTLISDPNVRDPSHSNGIEFRRMFRTPFPVFEDIVSKCRETNEKEFNYEENSICNVEPIPLELKILFVLRVLATGLTLSDATDLNNKFISNSEGNYVSRRKT